MWVQIYINKYIDKKTSKLLCGIVEEKPKD